MTKLLKALEAALLASLTAFLTLLGAPTCSLMGIKGKLGAARPTGSTDLGGGFGA
jgi:hypothetical protein